MNQPGRQAGTRPSSCSLEVSLQEVSLQAQHVRDHCSLVLQTFQDLQGTSARRDRFLLRPQQLVRSQLLAAAKLEAQDIGEARSSSLEVENKHICLKSIYNVFLTTISDNILEYFRMAEETLGFQEGFYQAQGEGGQGVSRR